MKKPVQLGLSILELSKKVMYELWYDQVKSEYRKKNYVIWIQTVSLYTNIVTYDIYKNIA